jgi:hypothetical protein
MAFTAFQLGEHLALVGKGNRLLHRGPDSEELAHFIEGSTKACCRGHTSEAAHGVGALFDTTMILLQSIVERAVGPVEHITTKGLTNRTRVGVMPSGRHPLWCMTHDIDCLSRPLRLRCTAS